jgi:hypothetical protein
LNAVPRITGQLGRTIVNVVPDDGQNCPSDKYNMVKTVADLCREMNLSIPDLAQRTGLDHGRVTAIALGRWTPSPAERQCIAAVFGVSVDDIAWGHQTPIQHLYGHGPG